MDLEFSRQGSEKQKILEYQISWKLVEWEPSCSMRTDWRTNANTETRLIAAIRNFGELA